MRALILCPGPSLAAVTELPPHDMLLAVNRAMSHPLAAGADWWVALDLWVWDLPTNRPRLGMVTCSAAIDEGQAQRVPWPLHDFMAHPKVKAVSTSLPAALWWAQHQGATTVELLGCDMAGTRDYTGDEQAERTEDRWSRERADCMRVVYRTLIDLKGLPCPR